MVVNKPCLSCPFLHSQYPATLVNEGRGDVRSRFFSCFVTSCFLVIVPLAETTGVHPTVRNADSEGREINTAQRQARLLTSWGVSDEGVPQCPSL